MIQISFEPAFDPFHAAFRLFQHTNYVDDVIPLERWRILDVYLAEPSRVLGIRLPNNLKAAAKRAAECQRPLYGRRPGTQSMYQRMRPFQEAAAQTLVQQGFLAPTSFENRLVEPTGKALNESLGRRVTETNERSSSLLEFLHSDLARFPLEGINGLKDRTRLGEFKYDLV